MNAEYTIRTATISDAETICRLLRRPIRQSCIADHKANERLLSIWLENKTTENMTQGLLETNILTLVGETHKSICTVSSTGEDGKIHKIMLIRIM
ncbi:MAG: hypothetical protein OEZ58_22760 [Gammaproteobacteria bacterium]|nr:hypothetical protein [Gammaproteobacteria bacterium]MDH5731814.1 hypothetical protein [Gammaproteobacteria bacterium]